MSVSKLTNIKAIIFDMDNTVINTRDGDNQNCAKLNYFLNEKFDLEFDTAEKITCLFLQLFRESPQNLNGGIELDEWRLSIWKQALGPLYSHLADDVYKEWLLLRYRHVKISPDVKSFLRELRNLYRLALLSNGASNAQWEKINNCGIKPYFDCIVVSGDTTWKKPDVEIFYKVCEELNVKPEQCVMIGDRVETDIEGGKKSGLAATVWVNYDSSYQMLPNETNYPDFTIKNVLELKRIFTNLDLVKKNKVI